MTARDFCYWLQGHFELSGVGPLTAEQAEMIRRHLSLVFLHEIDPQEPGDPAASQAVHDGVQYGFPPGSVLLANGSVLLAQEETTPTNKVNATLSWPSSESLQPRC